MKQIRSVAYYVLIALTGFLALTAFAGGIGILSGLNAPTITDMINPIFQDFTIPGVALFVIVGGSALLATILLVRKNKFALLLATVAGVIIMFFEYVEVLVIGSPAGVAQALQIFYFGLGTVITIVALGIWFIDLKVVGLTPAKPKTA